MMKAIVHCEGGSTISLDHESRGGVFVLLLTGLVEWDRDNKQWRAKVIRSMIEDLLNEFEVEYTIS